MIAKQAQEQRPQTKSWSLPISLRSIAFKLNTLAHRNGLWIWSALLSGLLLGLLMFFQQDHSDFLKLETKWLIVASIPLIIAVIRSNIIQRFKGFGIELETRLEDPVGGVITPQAELVSADVLIESPADIKGTMGYLASLADPYRQKIERLLLSQGRLNYYSAQHLGEYLRGLPNLKWLEVQDQNGRFVALLPVKSFTQPTQSGGAREANNGMLSKLINAIENNAVKGAFGREAITETVSDRESLIEVLPRLRQSRYGTLPVVSGTDELLGIITTRIVEKRIADAVLASHKRQ